MPSVPVSPGPHAGPRTPPAPVRVAIDLETTGLNAETDAIIEIGAVKFAGHRVLDRFETLVSPSAPLPFRIQRLTGITPAALRRAPALAAILTRLRTFVGEAPLVGHNVAFDAAFLRRVGLVARNPLIDTYELASMLLPALASYSLASVGDALGLHRDESHRALADADLSRRVFLALAERLGALETGAIEDLLSLPAGRDWTPGFLLRQELHSREARSGNVFAGVLTTSLGGQLASTLGVHPGALALAGAANTTSEPAAPQATTPATPAATPTGEARREAVASHMAPVLQSGGALLMEVEHDVDGIAACVAAALRWATQTDERLVIAVADADALRRLTRDVLPVARAALNGAGHTLQLAEIAHRGAYLCLWRWFGVSRSKGEMVPAEVSRGLSKLVVWSRMTPSGMRADVALSGQEQLAWERVRAGREFNELAQTCPYGKGGYCFLSAAQDAARDAQVMLTTHAALAAQLAGSDDLLPQASRVLILDAHLFEEALRETRSFTLDRTRLRDLLAALAATGPHGRAGLLHMAALALEGASGGAKTKQARERTWFEQVAAARHCVDDYYAALQTLIARTDAKNRTGGLAAADAEQRILLIDDDLRRSAPWRQATAVCRELVTHLTAVATTAREVASGVQAAERKSPGSGSGIPLELLGIAAQLESLVTGMIRIFDEATDDETGVVSWLRVPYANQNDRTAQLKMSGQPRGQPRGRGETRSEPTRVALADAESLRADVATAPVDGQLGDKPADNAGDSQEALPDTVALREEVPVLHSAMISVGELVAPLTAGNHALVLAGPSLSVAGDFEYVRGSLRLPETTAVASLLADREQQTLLCLPSDVPEPNAPRYQRTLEETLIQLATALDGRLVALFPSHAALRSAYNGIRRALEAKNILVLGQGQDGSVRQLWQSFATEQRVVLLGAGAFWDGSMLRRHPPACVVVAKLPFPAMSDPLLAARAAQWDDAQHQFVVPQATLKLRQALAGLAWSHERRNAVVLFDRRVQTRGYGSLVIGSLPRCSQHEEPVDALAERIAEWVGPA